MAVVVEVQVYDDEVTGKQKDYKRQVKKYVELI